MTTDTLSVADALRQAADLIDRVGFWRGRDDCPSGECAYTAIWEVAGGAHVAALAALSALRDHLGVDTAGDVFRWNDAASSAEVVTSKLRQAADAVDGRVPR